MVIYTKQLGNVAFGGSWSEELIQNGTTQDAIEALRFAAMNCDEVDPRGPELTRALDYVERHIDKGRAFRTQIENALSLSDPNQRKSKMLRYVSLVDAWL